MHNYGLNMPYFSSLGWELTLGFWSSKNGGCVMLKMKRTCGHGTRKGNLEGFKVLSPFASDLVTTWFRSLPCSLFSHCLLSTSHSIFVLLLFCFLLMKGIHCSVELKVREKSVWVSIGWGCLGVKSLLDLQTSKY